MEQNPQSQLKLLVQRGKEQGYLTYAEVNDHLPEDIVDSDQIEDIIQMINDMGIQVMEEAPDADDLLLAENSNSTDEDAEEAAAQVLSSVESEIGRTTDPVRMYMREMGTVELLTREGEIDIAKRIEDGINQVQCSVAEYPEAITYLLEQYDRVEAEEARLSDLITGFVDPNAEEDLAPTATHVGSELSQAELADDEDEDEESDDDSADDDNSIDPELAREKFGDLRRQYELARDTIKAKGRSHADAAAEILQLSEVFKQFRLVPKQFDYLVNSMRVMMDRVRTQERLIMSYDGDRAGRDAAWRALETALPYMTDGRQLRFMFLPDGEDPDTLVRKEGKAAFEARVEQAQPLSTFLFNSLLPQVDLSTPDGTARLSTLALPLIGQVPGETLRIYLRQELGNKLGILDDNQLEKLLPKQTESTFSRPAPQLKRTTMRILIGLLVQNPELAQLVPSLNGLDTRKLPGLELFMELVNTCLAQPGVTTGQLLEQYRGKNEAATLEKLSTWDDIADRDIAEQTFTDSLNHMFDSVLELRLTELIARSRTDGLTPSEREEVRVITESRARK